MFTYKIHLKDGSDVGENAYADCVRVGDELILGPGRLVRVLDVVPIDEDEGSRFTALLRVEAA